MGEQNSDIFKSLTLFHTTLRNIGLFTSVSLALLGYSRYYREKGNKLYNVAFVLISTFCLIIAINILHNMEKTNKIKLHNLNNEDKKLLNDWLILQIYIKYMLYSIFGFSVYTLVRQFKR
tara:strand:- start:963 stop:1322 length:360 start_codon:yes stop_codon:yes gene_type:complete